MTNEAKDQVLGWAMEMARAAVSEALGGRKSLDEFSAPIARALLAAERRGEEKKEAEIKALLLDPVAVRVNYLRGGIACQTLMDEAERRGIERAAKVADEAELVDSSLWSPGSEMNAYHDGQDYAGRTIAAAIRQLGDTQ